jgi:hypothetical protein
MIFAAWRKTSWGGWLDNRPASHRSRRKHGQKAWTTQVRVQFQRRRPSSTIPNFDLLFSIPLFARAEVEVRAWSQGFGRSLGRVCDICFGGRRNPYLL